MSATNDTPIKRFTAFWVVLGAFLLFGIIALILAPLTNSSEVTAADEAGAKRRLAVRELVDAEQVKNLSRVENGDKIQVAPSEVFSLVGAKLASTKPAAMKNEMFRDPAAVAASDEKSVEEAPANEKATPAAPVGNATKVITPAAATPEAKTPEPTATPAPAAKKFPTLTPQAPRPESTSESAEPSAN